jgi:hypothetical protein
MTSSAYDEAQWVQTLLAEAKRDLVFVFNIASGAFGGPRPAPAQGEVPGLLERVAAALLERGCIVGLGNPDTDDWVLPERLRVAPGRLPATIASFYAECPDEARFLVFAHRANRSPRADV